MPRLGRIDSAFFGYSHIIAKLRERTGTNSGYPEASRVMRALASLPRGTGVRRIRGGRTTMQGGCTVRVADSSRYGWRPSSSLIVSFFR